MSTTFRFTLRAETYAVDDDGMSRLMATNAYSDHLGLDRHNLAVVQAAAAKGVAAMNDALVACSFEQAIQKKLITDGEAAAYRDAVNGG